MNRDSVFTTGNEVSDLKQHLMSIYNNMKDLIVSFGKGDYYCKYAVKNGDKVIAYICIETKQL